MNIHPRAGPFVIAAGAILGICAGLLWTAQGSLMLAYPTEDQKGKFIGIFWGIFNLGAVVGASVSLGQNFHSTVRMQFSLATNRFLKNDELVDFRLIPVRCIFLRNNNQAQAQYCSWKWNICKSLCPIHRAWNII